MAEQSTAIAAKPTSAMQGIKKALNAESTKEQFQNALQENAGAFMASILDIVSSDTGLQKCDPNKVVMECLKAATLQLPINRQLGFAYVIAYKGTPQFQMGYRGYIQLAMRAGQFRYLNADIVCEGVKVHKDELTGSLRFEGQPTSDKPIGYFAYMELVNGFRKAVYMTKTEVEKHGKRFSKTYASGPWQTDFDAMALKTCIRKLSKFFPMTIQMAQVMATDAEGDVITDISENANSVPFEVEQQPEQAATEEQAEVDPGF